MDSGIYQLTFPNQQMYIGKSENIPKRWQTHRKNFELGKHTRKMQSVYNEVGPPEYKVLAYIHPDHIDIYEAIFIHKCWGPNLLNTAKPRPVDPAQAEALVDIYNDLTFNGESCMLYPTIHHVELIKQKTIELQKALDRILALESQGFVLTGELADKLASLERSLNTATNKLQRLQNRTLWQRIWNHMV